MRPVLLGGRQNLRSASMTGWLIRVWLPVVIMMLVIARESTALFGADNTSAWFRVGYSFFFGTVSDARWPEIHHILRKTGHFLGYGTMGLVWLRAWMLMWLQWMIHRPARVWRSYCTAMALACTALIASLDELHQSFLPNRTGVPQDVLLDCTGAVVLILLVSITWLIPNKRANA